MKLIFLVATLCLALAAAQTHDPSGIRRGAYISLYGYKIGTLYTEPIQGGDVYHIMGNSTREEISLNFLKHWNFNAITVYQFHLIRKSTELTARMKVYMERCRAIGITNIEVATSKWLSDYDAIKTWNDVTAENDDQKIDGLATEIEFWHSGDFSEITNALEYARGLGITARAGKPFYYATYLGGVTDAQTAALVPLIDYFWPHAYSKKVSSYYPMTQTRIQGLVKAQGRNVNSTSVMVTPIFSAESTKYSAYPNSVFGGDDLRARGNFSSMENEYKRDWEGAVTSDPATAPPVALLAGYQWYEYVFFYLVMSDITPRPIFTPAPPTPEPPTPPPTPAPPTPQPPASPLRCTTSADCLCPGTYCKSNGFCGGPVCQPGDLTPEPAAPATPEPPMPPPTHHCSTSADCPCSYCMNGPGRSAPYFCHRDPSTSCTRAPETAQPVTPQPAPTPAPPATPTPATASPPAGATAAPHTPATPAPGPWVAPEWTPTPGTPTPGTTPVATPAPAGSPSPATAAGSSASEASSSQGPLPVTETTAGNGSSTPAPQGGNPQPAGGERTRTKTLTRSLTVNYRPFNSAADTADEGSGSHLWIIGLIVGLLLVIVIVAFVARRFTLRDKKGAMYIDNTKYTKNFVVDVDESITEANERVIAKEEKEMSLKYAMNEGASDYHITDLTTDRKVEVLDPSFDHDEVSSALEAQADDDASLLQVPSHGDQANGGYINKEMVAPPRRLNEGGGGPAGNGNLEFDDI